MNAYRLPSTPSRIATAPSFSQRLRTSKALLPTLAVLGVTVLALAAALLMTRSQAEPDTTKAIASAVVPSAQATGKPPAVSPAQNSAYNSAYNAAPKTLAPRPVVRPAVDNTSSAYRPLVAVAAAPTCLTCGTVVSVTPVQRNAAPTGLGAVAGGVLGGVLGNQVGKGSGRTLATVAGAVGGGFAGNEVEKNVQTKTLYSIRVRMDDGSMRSFERANAFAVGSQVRVDNNTLRLDDGQG